MKKIYIFLFLLFISTNFFAQNIGVNTEDPTRSVDVNGNLRITNIASKENDDEITHLVVADVDGNIDKTLKPVSATVDNSVETKSRVVVLSDSNTPSITNLEVGGFVFGINNGKPAFRKTSGGSTTFRYSVKFLDRRTGPTSGSTSNSSNYTNYNNTTVIPNGRYFFKNYSKSVNSQTMIDIVDEFNISVSGKNNLNRTHELKRRDQYRLHLVHPSEPNFFYKVTYTRIQNSGTAFSTAEWNSVTSSRNDIWIIVVERYNNQNN